MKELKLYDDYLYSEIVNWCNTNNDTLEEIGEQNVVGLTFLATQCSLDNKTYSFVLNGYITSKGSIYKLIFKE